MVVNLVFQLGGFIINLFGVYNNFWVMNIIFNDLVVEENGEQVFDISNVISQMGMQNYLCEDLDIEIIGIGVQFGFFGFSLGYCLCFNVLIDYLKILV